MMIINLLKEHINKGGQTMIASRQLSTCRKINVLITKRIVELHENGYTYDFGSAGLAGLVCLQNGLKFINEEILIKLIDLQYDEVTKGFTYIHSVDTFSGYKGVMLSNRILCNCNWL